MPEFKSPSHQAFVMIPKDEWLIVPAGIVVSNAKLEDGAPATAVRKQIRTELVIGGVLCKLGLYRFPAHLQYRTMVINYSEPKKPPFVISTKVQLSLTDEDKARWDQIVSTFELTPESNIQAQFARCLIEISQVRGALAIVRTVYYKLESIRPARSSRTTDLPHIVEMSEPAPTVLLGAFAPPSAPTRMSEGSQ